MSRPEPRPMRPGRACGSAALAAWLLACAAPSPSGPQTPDATAQEWVAAALVKERPAVRIPVVVWFDDYNEVMVGTAIVRGVLERRTVDLRSRVRDVRCVGHSDLRIVPPDAIPGVRCDGMRGEGALTCSDRRELRIEFWTEETCLSGYAKGTDDTGHTFHSVFGGSTARADRIVREALADLASKPDLPAPRANRDATAQGGLSTGTAFFVSWDGHLVTNYHVVRDASRVQVKLDDGELVAAEVLVTDERQDLALLKVDAIGRPLPLRRKSNLVKGQDVFTLGYPLITLQGQEQKATFGRVNALSGLRGDERLAQIDVPIQPGNSGGPLFNERGEVVGIVTSMLHPWSVIAVAGALPQNVNYAIKSDLVHEMVRYRLGTRWREMESPRVEQLPSELIPGLEGSVVLVVVQ